LADLLASHWSPKPWASPNKKIKLANHVGMPESEWVKTLFISQLLGALPKVRQVEEAKYESNRGSTA